MSGLIEARPRFTPGVAGGPPRFAVFSLHGRGARFLLRARESE